MKIKKNQILRQSISNKRILKKGFFKTDQRLIFLDKVNFLIRRKNQSDYQGIKINKTEKLALV